MSTCDTCKWWIKSDENNFEEEDWMLCDQPRLLKFQKPDNDGVSLMDGSYYRAVLHTGPKFGCLHHENK